MIGLFSLLYPKKGFPNPFFAGLGIAPERGREGAEYWACCRRAATLPVAKGTCEQNPLVPVKNGFSLIRG